MCERTVSEDSTRVVAISSVDWPWHRRSRTSHSRAVSGLRTGRMPAPSSRVRRTVSTRRVVSRREMTASPSEAARSARGIDSMFTVFDRNPQAPMRSDSRPSSSSSDDVIITTFASGWPARISRVAAMPSVPGISRSMRTTSGL